VWGGFYASNRSPVCGWAIYVDGVISRLETALNQTDRAPGFAAMVLKFANYLEDELRASREAVITLGYTHGDFSVGNLLKARDKVFGIDWESASRRSVCFDLYNFLFSELHKGRAAVLPRRELDRALDALGSVLKRQEREPPDIATLSNVYRKLFYLERLLALAERRRPDQRDLRVVMRTLEVFSRYERKSGHPLPAARTAATEQPLRTAHQR